MTSLRLVTVFLRVGDDIFKVGDCVSEGLVMTSLRLVTVFLRVGDDVFKVGDCVSQGW